MNKFQHGTLNLTYLESGLIELLRFEPGLEHITAVILQIHVAPGLTNLARVKALSPEPIF